MQREEALRKLRQMLDHDLVALAAQHGVRIWHGDKKDKGWAGRVIEACLGLPQNSSRSPNFGSWELKVVSVKYNRAGLLVPKETMAITMLDPDHGGQTPFEQSHLLAKLRRLVVCARLWHGKDEERSELVRVDTFDLNDPQLLDEVREDYERVRAAVNTQGPDALTGRMGRWVQPRTKGLGHGSKTRAFYARTCLVARLLRL